LKGAARQEKGVPKGFKERKKISCAARKGTLALDPWLENPGKERMGRETLLCRSKKKKNGAELPFSKCADQCRRGPNLVPSGGGVNIFGGKCASLAAKNPQKRPAIEAQPSTHPYSSPEGERFLGKKGGRSPVEKKKKKKMTSSERGLLRMPILGERGKTTNNNGKVDPAWSS